MPQKTTQLSIPGVFTVLSDRFDDHRGIFLESYREDKMGMDFVQGNVSVSKQNVVRGLHYQLKKPQGKFMRTVSGRTFNALVDMREGSPTLGKGLWTWLSDPAEALWIPPGFAAGFAALDHRTVVVYECSSYYYSGCDRAVNWRAFDLPWPVNAVDTIMSEKDRNAVNFDKADLVPVGEWRS